MEIYKNSILVFAVSIIFSFSSSAFGQQVSDAALKKNVKPLENALEAVQKLEPKRFEYNQKEYGKLKLPAGQQYGFLAEDIQRVLPELLSNKSESYMVGKNKYQTTTRQETDLVSLIPLLVAAIQEQQQELERLQKQVQSLSAGK
jgi:hypothetical protein